MLECYKITLSTLRKCKSESDQKEEVVKVGLSQASHSTPWLFCKIKRFFFWSVSSVACLVHWELLCLLKEQSGLYLEQNVSLQSLTALLQALVIQIEINPSPRLTGSPMHAAVIGFFTSKGHVHSGFASFRQSDFNIRPTWEWKHHKCILARLEGLFCYLQNQTHVYKGNWSIKIKQIITARSFLSHS